VQLWIRRAAVVAVVASLFAAGGTAAKDPLPEGAAAAQLTADAAYLQTGLGKKAKNAVTPLKSTAMLIALNAQNQLGGKDGEKMAGARDAALKVAAALSKTEPDWDAAAKAAAEITTGKGDAKKTVKLHEQNEFDVHDLMTVFKPKNRGGRGLEDDIRKGSKTGADPKATAEMGVLVHLIGQYTEAMAPKDEGADKQKKWTEWAKEMQKLGKEAAEEGLKGAKADKAAITKKLLAVDANCTACHNVFKK
jgi:hypothetical protein